MPRWITFYIDKYAHDKKCSTFYKDSLLLGNEGEIVFFRFFFSVIVEFILFEEERRRQLFIKINRISKIHS